MLIKSWNNKQIRWREDGFGCLTDMAKAVNKQVSDWMRLKGTDAYFKALSESRGIPLGSLIDTVVSEGQNNDRGTWADRRVCIRFAQWCSPEFAVQVDLWVEEIMSKGYVDIRNMSSAEALHHMTGELWKQELERQRLKQDIIRLENSRIQHLQQIIEQAEQLEKIDNDILDVKAEMNRVINPDGYYYTILGYNQRQFPGRALSRQEAGNLGRSASRMCREMNLTIQPINDVRFGKVNSYPEEVLQQVFNEHN